MADETSVRSAVDNLVEAFRQWLSQLIWYPGCLVTDVSLASSGYIICQIQGGTNQQCGWKNLFSIAVGDYVDVLYDTRSMSWEVFKPGVGSTAVWDSASDVLIWIGW
jgi:hypothetical protein